MAKFGGNEFTGFSVPLVFNGRYFVLEPGNPPQLTVFREVNGQPIFEVLKNHPGENATMNPTGVITVTNPATGAFAYKVRPGSETSVVFGTLQGEEIDCRIADKEIRIGTSRFTANRFDGAMAGIVVRADGSMGIGAPLPDAVRRLLR